MIQEGQHRMRGLSDAAEDEIVGARVACPALRVSSVSRASVEWLRLFTQSV